MNKIRKYSLVTLSYLIVVILVIVLDVLYLKSAGGTGTTLTFNNTQLTSYLVLIIGGLAMIITSIRLNRTTKASKLCRSSVYKLHMGVLILGLISIILTIQVTQNITIISNMRLSNMSKMLSDGNTPLRFISFGFIWGVIMSVILIINALRSKQRKYILYTIPYIILIGFIYFFIDL